MSILLASATYWLIEKPIRFGGFRHQKTFTLLALMITSGAIGYGTFYFGGLGFRAASNQPNLKGDISHHEYHQTIAERYPICTPESIAKEALRWEGFVRCNQSKGTPDSDIALIGDSHAEHLFPGIAAALPTKNVVFYIKAGMPILGNPEFERIFDVVRDSRSTKIVILSMFWSRQLSEISPVTFENALSKTIDMLLKSGKRVYLMDDVPTFPFLPARCKFKRPLSGKDQVCDVPATAFRRDSDTYMSSLIKVLRSRPGARLFHVGEYFCDASVCSMRRNDSILFRDTNHLNMLGSLYLGDRLIAEHPEAFR
jgi:hypothetical protein